MGQCLAHAPFVVVGFRQLRERKRSKQKAIRFTGGPDCGRRREVVSRECAIGENGPTGGGGCSQNRSVYCAPFLIPARRDFCRRAEVEPESFPVQRNGVQEAL